jgi:hypothetical protein
MAMRRFGIGLVTVVAAVAAPGLVGSAPGAEQADCRPPDAHTWAYDAELKLYTRRGAATSQDPLYVCRRPRGRRTELVSLAGELWFKPPAISLSRFVVAIGIKGIDPSAETSTSVYVYDFTSAPRRHSDGSDKRVRNVFVGLDTDVGSVVVNGSYDVAYINCIGREADDYVAPSPQCRKPGRSKNHVVVAPMGDDKGTIVDTGRQVDPASLRLQGDRVSWVKNGKRRSAPLR